MGLGERSEAKLMLGSEKRGALKRVEERIVVIGSGGGGVEREGLHELGCGRERHYYFVSATS